MSNDTSEHDPFTMWRNGDIVPYHLQSHVSYRPEDAVQHEKLLAKRAELTRNAPDYRKRGTQRSWHTPDEEQKK